jgi:hypothetical protein
MKKTMAVLIALTAMLATVAGGCTNPFYAFLDEPYAPPVDNPGYSDDPVVSNDPEDEKPTFESAEIDGDILVITLSEEVSGSPDVYDFSVSGIDGGAAVLEVEISGESITLTLDSYASFGETVRVSYTKNSSSSKQIKDEDGNALASFTNKRVTNNTEE